MADAAHSRQGLKGDGDGAQEFLTDQSVRAEVLEMYADLLGASRSFHAECKELDAQFARASDSDLLTLEEFQAKFGQ